MYSTLTSFPFILSLLLLGITCRALLSPNVSYPSEAVVQQSLELAPPFPILKIGYMHMLSEASTNATQAKDNNPTGHHIQSDIAAPVHVAVAAPVPAAQCNAASPCVDASCCNSVGGVEIDDGWDCTNGIQEGQCGFTPNNCNTTAATTCISNCDAHAMCGVDSLYGEQKCPLGLCCSFLGYCGVSLPDPMLTSWLTEADYTTPLYQC